MKNMTLENIARVCRGILFCGSGEGKKEIKGVALDSRKVEKDFLFIATKGERVDGHTFIPGVFEKGVCAVISERKLEEPAGAYILVTDSFAALKDIAEFYRNQLSIKIIGITGSVGKTSTKECIASVLSQQYNVLKTEGNFNNEVGLPLTVCSIREEHEIAVLEMGISDFGEMHRLSKIAKPDICVITNIGQCHLENLKSRSGVLSAKTEIFNFMNKDGSVCINGDDDMLRSISCVNGKEPIAFGLSKECSVYADNIKYQGLLGTVCMIHTKEENFSVEIPIPGEHMVYNALAAASVGKLFGMSAEKIAQGIVKVMPVGGRNNIIKTDQFMIIDDCYNANPISMKASIDVLETAATRKVAILGDMGELGKNEEPLHAEIGAYIIKHHIDILICVGKLSAYMKKAAEEADREGKTKVFYYETKQECVTHIKEILQADDTILIKASHFMGFEDIVKLLR